MEEGVVCTIGAVNTVLSTLANPHTREGVAVAIRVFKAAIPCLGLIGLKEGGFGKEVSRLWIVGTREPLVLVLGYGEKVAILTASPPNSSTHRMGNAS